MTAPAHYPDFPGAVGLTDLTAYPWPTDDDEHGGTPHLHLACSECYVVTGGSGRLETLTRTEIQVHPLRPGDVVWFTPGTIHRAVNDGDLRVIVVMQNGGLPEAGDAVMTFPAEYLTADRYWATASILDDEGGPSAQRARARRDLALSGFAELKLQWQNGDPAPLDAFYQAAADLVRPRLPEWETTVRDGAAKAVRTTLRQIDALKTGDWRHLQAGASARIAEPTNQSLGMCGFLRPYDSIRRSGRTES